MADDSTLPARSARPDEQRDGDTPVIETRPVANPRRTRR